MIDVKVRAFEIAIFVYFKKNFIFIQIKINILVSEIKKKVSCFRRYFKVFGCTINNVYNQIFCCNNANQDKYILLRCFN